MIVSRYSLRFSIVLLALLFLPMAAAWAQRSGGEADRASRSMAGALATEGDLLFVENRGQIVDARGEERPEIVYTSGRGSIFFRRDGVSYLFTRADSTGGALASATATGHEAYPSHRTTGSYRMDVEFVGADPGATISAEEQSGGSTHYYRPHAPDGITGARSFRRLIYHGIYPGIDLHFHSDEAGLKYDFIVHPGADPSVIRLRYHGADSVLINDEGELVAHTMLGAITEGAPFSYQPPASEPAGMGRGEREEVECRWIVEGNEAHIELGDYDPRRTLVIDPTLLWATYYGGSSAEAFFNELVAMTIDAGGDIVIAGTTLSPDLPVTPGYQPASAGDYDTFVAKFDATGNRLWATYYGGTKFDMARGVDAGNGLTIAVAGRTESSDFPVSPGAIQKASGGAGDAFVVLFDGTGQRLWGTYYGGNASDVAQGVAIDRSGAVAITGYTLSGNLPTSGNAMQKSLRSHDHADAFVAKFNPAGGLAWSTYYGGSMTDRASAIAIDGSGRLAIAGTTDSPDLPIAAPSAQPGLAGQSDAFVALFSGDGDQRWGSYLGGDSTDEGNDIAFDRNGDLLLCGATVSFNFPTTSGSFQPKLNGNGLDIFIAKIDAGGNLQWGTYYGGTGHDDGYGIWASGADRIYITGMTNSTDFPVTPDAYQSAKDGTKGSTYADAFLIELDPDGRRLWSTYYGGEEWDMGSCVVTNGSGDIYITGATYHGYLPGTSRGFQKTPSGSDDAFIAKFGAGRECGILNPIIVPSGPPELCVGNTMTLTAPDGYARYEWLPGGETTRSITVTAGTYRVRVMTTDGCQDTSRPIQIIARTKPRVSIRQAPLVEICADKSLTITSVSSNAASLLWSTGETTPIITVTQPGVYTVTATSSYGCTESASVTVVLSSGPPVHVTGPSSVCAGSTFTYSTPTVNSASYRWNLLGNGTIIGSNTGRSITIQWGAAGTGSIALVAADATTGCTAIDRLDVTIGDTLRPMVLADGPLRRCQDDSVKLDAGDGYARYLWSTGEMTRTIVARSSGRYVVTVSTSDGCSGSEAVEVIIDAPPTPIITGPVTACPGTATVYATTGSPGHDYAWTITGGTIISGQGTNAITVLWDNRAQGLLQLAETIQGPGCSALTPFYSVTVGSQLPLALLPDGDITLCEGDSITLSASPGFESYLWSTGETTPSIVVKTAGVYNLTASDGSCTRTSSNAVIVVHPRPAPAIGVITQGNRTILDAGAGYASYRWSTGDTTRRLVLHGSGSYTVTVTDSAGCTGVSEPFIVLPLTETSIAVSTHEATPGEIITVAIRLAASRNLARYGAITYNGALRFNATLLHPVEGTPDGVIDGGDRVVPFNGILRDTAGVLATLKFLVLLGDSALTPLRLDSFTWGDDGIATVLGDGMLRLQLCAEDGDRLVTPGGRAALKGARPDPVHDAGQIEYELIEDGPVRLTINDMLGREVMLLLEEDARPGAGVIRFDGSKLPPGLYLITLRTPTGYLSAPMRIVR